MLALSFLLLIGVSLVADGLGQHISKGYIYFAMGFSVFVEMINIRMRGKGKPDRLQAAPDGYVRIGRRVIARHASAPWSVSCSPPRRPSCRRRPATCPSRVFDTRAGPVHGLRSHARRPRRRRRRLRRRAARRSEHASARTGGPARRSRADAADVIVSLEMFERDVQEPVRSLSDGPHGGGRVPEGVAAVAALRDRLQAARRLRDRARTGRSSAANVPRPIASEVAKAGLDVLQPRSQPTRRSGSRAICSVPIDDEYFKRFAEAMGDHGGAGASPTAAEAEKRLSLERFYFSQCVKDETMAESIAQRVAGGRDRRQAAARRALQRRVPQRLRPGHRRARRRDVCPASGSSWCR